MGVRSPVDVLLAVAVRQTTPTQKRSTRGEGAVDLLGGDWDRVLSTAAHDTDECSLDSVADNCTVYEKWLEFLILTRDVHNHEPRPAAAATVSMRSPVGKGTRLDSRACLQRRGVALSTATGFSDRMISPPGTRLVSMPTTTTPPSSALQKRATA